MRSSYSRNRRKLWPLLLAGIVALVLVAVVGVGVGMYVGDRSAEADPSQTTAPTAAKPTWDVKAQPVPNEHGSYGQNKPEDVARSFVIETFSWSADEPLPDGWLSRVRPTVTDTMFESLLTDGMAVAQDDAAEGVVGREINVSEVLNEIGDPTKLTVKYEVTDIMADGTTEAHDGTEQIAVELALQEVQLPEGSGSKTVEEYRVQDAWKRAAWGETEEEES